MISAELRAHIRRLFYGEHWKIGTIAAELRVHHDAVERAVEPERFINVAYRAKAVSLDPYKDFVRATLEQYPRVVSTRILEMIRQRGYKGSVWPLRRFVKDVRPGSRHEAFFRLSMLPGEQGQVDWGSFGRISIGNTMRLLSCFVMVLSWSRALFARFVLDQTMESFLRCHHEGFLRFRGVPRSLLYDNLKTAVLERVGDVIRFHPRLLDFAGHYHFAPTPVAVARGNEKGRVERSIRYLRESFFAARTFHSLEHLNAQLDQWIDTVAHARTVPGDVDKRTVAAALDLERPRLLAPPAHPFPCDLVRPIASGKTPYVRFDANDYSILDGDAVVAHHARSYERGKTLEQEEHLASLAGDKRRAREHRGRGRLAVACPHATAFLEQVAIHGGHLGGTTARLLRLLDQYGAPDLDDALVIAHQRGAFSAQSVAHILDQRRRGRGASVPLPPVLPDDPRVRDTHVTPHALGTYDVLVGRKGDGHE
jgi:transposase